MIKISREPGILGSGVRIFPYQDVATSTQTGHARILFEENSGLTQVYPVDKIEEAIQAHLKSQVRRAKTPLQAKGRGRRRASERGK